MHQAWNVDVFSLGGAMKTFFIFKTMYPRYFAKCLMKLEELMMHNVSSTETLTILREKHTKQLEAWISWNDRNWVDRSRSQAIGIVKFADDCLQGDSPFILGTEFSMADVLAVTALARISHFSEFYAAEVETRPKVHDYFMR